MKGKYIFTTRGVKKAKKAQSVPNRTPMKDIDVYAQDANQPEGVDVINREKPPASRGKGKRVRKKIP